jgi:hypothetical protein
MTEYVGQVERKPFWRMIPKSGYRLPACATPVHGPRAWIDASAGEGRSEKIMRKIRSWSGMTIRRKVITL